MTTPLTLEPPHAPSAQPWPRLLGRLSAPVVVAAGFFLVLCVAVLTKTTALLEPDDYAYRASIAALLDGHLWLTNSQYLALSNHLSIGSGGHGVGIMQWVHRSNGTWISEKNPGYPFFVAPFSWLGIERIAPLFYGGLASISLYLGGSRWLGRWGGAAAVALFCSSGAAMVFAWRATMPTFTDASMVAAGCGLLLWTVLAVGNSPNHRTIVGLLAFFAFDSAMFIRYTNLVALACAVGAVVLIWLFSRSTLPRRALPIWLATQVAFAIFLVSLNDYLYGHFFSTGYATGEITFSLGAFSGNLQTMPKNLLVSMPMIVVSGIALIWLVVAAAVKKVHPDGSTTARQDLWLGLGLAAVWLGIFGLYFFYDWTAHMGMGGPGGPGSSNWGNVHLIRFYLPAIGPVALLGAWLLVRIPPLLAAIVMVGLVVLGLFSFNAMASSGALGGGPGGHGFACGLPHGKFPSGFGRMPPNGGFPGGPGQMPPNGGFPRVGRNGSGPGSPMGFGLPPHDKAGMQRVFAGGFPQACVDHSTPPKSTSTAH